MADAEIQILIKAVDEVSATMSRIEGTLEKSNKNIQKQTMATSETFDKQMGSLLVLGSTASRVDTIFSSYQNLQIRLENASERVTGAQDRLRKAQYNLSKVQKDTSKTALDVADAQADVDSATRGLTISMNNQARANNMVIGTYINIGVQAVTLIAQLPVLIKSVESLTIAGWAFVATPLGITLVALAGIITLVTLGYRESKKSAEEYKQLQEEMEKTAYDLSVAQQDVNNVTNEWARAISEVKAQILGFIIPKTAEEAKLLADIAQAEGNVAQARLDGSEYAIMVEQRRLDQLQMQYDAEYSTKRSFAEAWLEYLSIKSEEEKGINKDVTDKTKEMFILDYNGIKTYLETDFYPVINEKAEQYKTDEINRLQALQKEWEILFIKQLQYNQNIVSTQAKTITSGTPGISSGKGTVMNYNPNTVKDFISRPGQSPVSFSSDDTIVGMKDVSRMGGISITITGNIYGTNPDEMAEALVDKLRRKISI